MRRNLNLLKLVFLTIVVLAVCFSFLPKYYSYITSLNQVPILQQNSITNKIESESVSEEIANSTKLILYWIPMWNNKTFQFGEEGFQLFKNCKFQNCFATHSKSSIPLEKFHAIVFHTAQYNEKIHGEPWVRSNEQRYVFANMEAPIRNYPTDLKQYGSFYNWTMTYRLDSDIVRPYGRIIKTATNYVLPNITSIVGKTKLVAWLVSHCFTINRRQDLYKSLRRYIKIDVYGDCGQYYCPKEKSAKCYKQIEKEYKFYLSFENSHCKDYVTEKLYRILERDIVPVVYGGADYNAIAPPNSVIIADNYPSTKHLAEYLLFLDKNHGEYLKYFEWKKMYSIEISDKRAVCRLCEMLNDSKQPSKVYEDIFTWWLGKNHSCCKLGNQLSNISFYSQ